MHISPWELHSYMASYGRIECHLAVGENSENTGVLSNTEQMYMDDYRIALRRPYGNGGKATGDPTMAYVSEANPDG